MPSDEKAGFYRVLRALPGGRGWVAAAGDRRVVLKPLDQDCLLDGQIHPTIRLRLQRIQELPLTSVANLYGVEEIERQPRLVWAFVEGATLQDADRALDEARIKSLRREVLHAVSALHACGIVHGDLHARNIFLDDRGAVHLTHISPLLYDDPKQDLDAIDRMFGGGDGMRSGAATGLESTGELTVGLTGGLTGEVTSEPAEPRALRTRAIVAATIAAAVGIGIALFIARYSVPAL